MTHLTLLEWLCFGLGAITVWQYGYSKKRGAFLGMTTAAMFMGWGYEAHLYGALTINLGFFGLHFNNMRRALQDA